jgi:hypothetical protein
MARHGLIVSIAADCACDRDRTLGQRVGRQVGAGIGHTRVHTQQERHCDDGKREEQAQRQRDPMRLRPPSD